MRRGEWSKVNGQRGRVKGELVAVIASNDFFRAKKEKKLNDIHTLLLVFFKGLEWMSL